METAIDRFGRIVIPKQVRDDLGLKPGALLRVEESEQQVVLKPVVGEPHVAVKDGILVFTGTAAGDIMAAVRAQREERLHKVAGGRGK